MRTCYWHLPFNIKPGKMFTLPVSEIFYNNWKITGLRFKKPEISVSYRSQFYLIFVTFCLLIFDFGVIHAGGQDLLDMDHLSQC